MKKIIFLVIIILILAISFLVEFFQFEILNKSFIAIGSSLNIIQTIATIAIAYLLYDRFGTAKKLLESRNKVIIDLLIEIKKIDISFAVIDKENNTQTVMPYRNFGSKISNTFTNDFLDKRVVYHRDHNFSYLFKIRELINHPLFPTELKRTKSFFTINTETNARPSLDKYEVIFVKINSDFKDKIVYKEDDLWHFDDKEFTLKNLLTEIEEVIKEIQNWINNNSSIKIKLNL